MDPNLQIVIPMQRLKRLSSMIQYILKSGEVTLALAYALMTHKRSKPSWVTAHVLNKNT